MIEQTIRINGINVQLDSTGNIVGFIHPEKLLQELQNLTVNKDGCIKFTSEKRNNPVAPNGKTYSHMGPRSIIIIPTSTQTQEELTTTPSKSSFFSLFRK